MDGYLGGVQTISASSTNITLTAPSGFTATPSGGPTQSQNAVLRITGTLTASVAIVFPLPGYMIIENLTVTSGAFVIVLKASGVGETISPDVGSVVHVYNDGTNIRFVDLPPVGSYLDVCEATVPAWISNCSKPPYLLCDGSTFNATTYPYLNLKLGGNTLPDFRGRSPYYLNGGTGRLTSAGAGIDGNTRFSGGGNNGILLDIAHIPSHTHTVNDPGHLHANAVINQAGAGGNNEAANGPGAGYNNPNTGISTTGITVLNTGGGQSFGNAAPGITSGLRLIRAG